MGTGTDVAMESAGVTLVKGDLRGIVRAIRLSKARMKNIKHNLFFAFAYNALGVPIAAAVPIGYLWSFVESDDCCRCDELKFRISNWKCFTTARSASLGIKWNCVFSCRRFSRQDAKDAKTQSLKLFK